MADPLPAAASGAATEVEEIELSRPLVAEQDLTMVKSPIVGTFYEAPAPGAPPFVQVGTQVQAGQVLCIIEAMKLMNEIESEVPGEIVKIFVQNGQPVEYSEPLFAIRPLKRK
jgi:acetyl-CoA carboxylase biotin carboxyl carrier protein